MHLMKKRLRSVNVEFRVDVIDGPPRNVCVSINLVSIVCFVASVAD